MKRLSPPRLAAARRALALAGLALMAAGLMLLPAAARPPAAAATPAFPSSPVTIQGQRLYNGTSGLLARRSSVTVSQTTDLVNQTVRVSWAHFTPSSSTSYDTQASLYAVMVAECSGTHPTQWGQCYGASNGGVQGSSGPAGPYNAVYDTTAPNGTGAIGINVETALENSVLGCDQHHPCSLVVVPGQGGNEIGYPNTKFQCSNHTQDGAFGGNYGEPQSTFSSTTGFCSWKDRIIIPLRFSAAVSGCPLTSTQFSMAGSPMMARAMLQWLSGLCAGTNPLAISYNSTIQEPQALEETSSGVVDVALTTRPASADTADGVTLPGDRHYIYAPVAVSAVSIAYWVDSPVTGQPVTNLKLDPRLAAKLLTTSYSFGDGCVKGQPPPNGIGYCDKAVSGNPFSIFNDPEFRQLNPAVQPVTGQGGTYQVPTVQSGNSDMTWTLTRWIAASPAASAFLGGQRDPWGMQVNTRYQGVSYPADSFIGQDPYPFISHLFNPLFPLSQVAYHQSLNWDAGTSWQKDQYGNYPSDTPEIPGQRALFAILDEADAAAFQFPVARITNAAGAYVQPTGASMAAAAANMTSDGTGTEQMDLANGDPQAYPLTMVIYAAVPTAGTPPAKAAAIARFLDFAAGAGQTQGDQPGQLPAGYLPLPAALAAQTQQAATEVANQVGNQLQHNTPAPAPVPLPTLSAKPASTPSLALPRVTPGLPPITTTTVADPQRAASTRYVLPVLLMLGGLCALAGSSMLMTSARTSVATLLWRAGRAGLGRGRRGAGRLSRRRRP